MKTGKSRGLNARFPKTQNASARTAGFSKGQGLLCKILSAKGYEGI
jgi:hypothetical protein